MATFIAHYEPGPAWLAGRPLREQPLGAHVAYLVDLHEKGSVLMGGPLADGSGGFVVFSADSGDQVAALLAGDPAIREGILVASAREWSRIV